MSVGNGLHQMVDRLGRIGGLLGSRYSDDPGTGAPVMYSQPDINMLNMPAFDLGALRLLIHWLA